MKYTVKFLAMTLVCALALGLTGCHTKTPTIVMTIDDVEIPAGVYLMTQMQAYSDAVGKLTEEKDKKNVLKATIEEKKGAAWIHDETLRMLRRYAYLEKEFAAQGLAFTDDEKATAATQVKNNWASSETILSENGVGQASYTLMYENEMKYEKLFTAFAEENSKKLTDADTKAYMDGIYTHVTMLTLPTTKEDGTALEEADLKKITALAETLKGALTDEKDLAEQGPETLKKAFEICGRTYTDDLEAQYLSTTFITEDYAYFPEELLEKLLAAKVGDADVYTTDSAPMVYQKIANYADETEYLSYKDTLQNSMNIEAFDAKIEADADAYALAEDADAVRIYSPGKVKLA